ncbi:MAG TPA: helical backbone metal receptor [Burkholderiales bacterium]|nr:helical backbone metal receptor [Burkholderiales bacterium]
MKTSLAVFAAAFFALAGGAPAAGAQTIRDDLGRPFVLPEKTPARIVSMAPNITEILFALGLGPHVAGATRFCDYPPEAQAVPRIGGLVDPNIEIIQSLRPDLVIAFRGNPLRILERLSDLHLPVFILDIGNGLDALYPLIERIGQVTRRESEASALAASLRARERSVESALGVVVSKPRVFVFLYGQGLWTCGGQSYLNDVIIRAGAVNIAAPLPKKWALYSRERIVRDDPDAVFVLAKSSADFAKARVWLAGEARLGTTAAVASGRVFLLDENAASRFGPRLVEVLAAMARALHPERFGGRP